MPRSLELAEALLRDIFATEDRLASVLAQVPYGDGWAAIAVARGLVGRASSHLRDGIEILKAPPRDA